MTKRLLLIGIVMCLCLNTSAQFSVRVGVNFASADKEFLAENALPNFKSTNLNAFQIGAMYQKLSKINLGIETGVYFTQKGCSFSYETDSLSQPIHGYNEMNCIEIPLNLKYVFRIGTLGVYAAAGVYGSCAFSGKTTTLLDEDIKTKNIYSTFKDRIDVGYNANLGIELFKKIQLGATWSQSLLPMRATEEIMQIKIPTATRHKVWTVALSYFF